MSIDKVVVRTAECIGATAPSDQGPDCFRRGLDSEGLRQRSERGL